MRIRLLECVILFENLLSLQKNTPLKRAGIVNIGTVKAV